MPKNQKRFISLALGACLFVMSLGIAWAQDIRAPRFTIGNGGGSVSTSKLHIHSSMGQPMSGIVRSSSGSVQLCTGIECGLGPHSTPSAGATVTPTITPTPSGTPSSSSGVDVYLPLVEK